MKDNWIDRWVSWWRRGLSVQNRSKHMSLKVSCLQWCSFPLKWPELLSAPLQWTPFLLGMTSIQYTYRSDVLVQTGNFCNAFKPSRCAVSASQNSSYREYSIWQFTAGSAPSLTHFFFWPWTETDCLNCKYRVLETLRLNLLFLLLHNNPTVVWDRYRMYPSLVFHRQTSLVLSFIPHRPPF